MLQTPKPKHGVFSLITALCTLFFASSSFAFQVSDISATYKNGQVFITWKNPNSKHLQYNVYRSTSKFTGSSQLTSSKLLGFVRDSSAKNIRLSQEYEEQIFYKIANNGQPLTGDRGLYVVTCTDNQSYYYAVTVTNLSSGNENKSIVLSKNSLSTPVDESVAKPQPVWQDSIFWSTGDVVQQYVQFVNNQETPLYPAMNSTGSYGFNFYLIKRGQSDNFPLFVFYEGLQENSIKGNGLDEFANLNITDCYILGVDDWLPIPTKKGIGVGENTYFCCYHENFNIYESENPIPETGIVKTYPQKRYIESIEWAKNEFNIDTSRVYLVGVSAGGFGALLTASIIPEKIAAVYSVVEPVVIKPVGNANSMYGPEQMWGTSTVNLYSDIPDPISGEPLLIYTLLNIKKMSNVNETLDLPLIFDIHGRNDPTVEWGTLITSWYDSLESNHCGGIFFWDGREHDGAEAGFLDAETTPDFYKYSTALSYPAFSHCTIDDNPGDGAASSGTPYGALNGYLGWDSIEDKQCSYSIKLFVKELYIGGVLDPQQYNTCKTDVTLRRLQNFQVEEGATIKWNNYDYQGGKIGGGSITYNGSEITLKDLKVKKGANILTLTLPDCEKIGEESSDTEHEPDIYFTKSTNGYQVHIESGVDQEVYVNVYDLLGRVIHHTKVSLMQGTNTYEVASPGNGIFLVGINGSSFSHTEKLLF